MIVTKSSKISWLVLWLIIEACWTQTPSKTFSCQNGEYIESIQYCDGFSQCSDGSDEPPVCSSTRRNCEPGKFLCPTSGSCQEADLLSDVHVQKYCPQETTTNPNNITAGTHITEDIFSEIVTLTTVFSRVESSSDPKFRCDNVRCLNVHYVCEEFCDCFNCSGGSQSFPEVGNLSKTEVVNCSSQNDKFLCGDNKRCLSLEYVCDGYCNCFDCSDENGDCSTVDHKILGTCPDYYFPTPSGARCLRDLSNNTENSSKTNQLTDCRKKHICDQKCIQFKTRAICSCNVGYIKVNTGYSGFRCQRESSQNTLLYSTPKKIKLLNLTTGEVVVIKNQADSKMLAAAHDYFYYTDNRKRIFKRSLTLEDTTEMELDNMIDGPITSIAVDYITDNLYFTTNTTLSVCGSNNKICMWLLFNNVKYVALAPSYGWMFYTVRNVDLGEVYIMKNNMDGSNETVLIDGRFRSVTALAADESIRRLYGYSSSKDEFFSVSFFGDNNEYRATSYHGTLVSMTALDSKLFYTANQDRQIHDLENNEYFTKPVDGNSKISRYAIVPKSSELLPDFPDYDMHLIEADTTFAVEYLYAYDATRQRINQKARNPCSGQNKCSGLCLLKSKNTATDSGLGFSCFCNGVSLTTIPFWCPDKLPPSSTMRPTQSTTRRVATTKFTPKSRSLGTTNISTNSNVKETTTSQPSLSSDKPLHHSGLETVGCVIALCIVLLCVGYISYNKWKQYYYNSVLRQAAQRQYSDQERLHFEQDDL